MVCVGLGVGVVGVAPCLGLNSLACARSQVNVAPMAKLRRDDRTDLLFLNGSSDLQFLFSVPSGAAELRDTYLHMSAHNDV